MKYASEEYRPVLGEPDYYVSRSGNILSLCSGIPRILKAKFDGKGYAFVNLGRRRKIHRNRKVHRLVAIAFLPNPDSKPQVNHKDGDKRNNCVSNLEWVSQSENILHAFSTGLMTPQIGEQQAQHKLTEADVLTIRAEYAEREISYRGLAKRFGVSATLIRYVIIRKNWKHI